MQPNALWPCVPRSKIMALGMSIVVALSYASCYSILMTTAQRDQAVLADTYAAISSAGKTGLSASDLRHGTAKIMAAEWAIEQLEQRGMIVQVARKAGRIDRMYATVRNAKG